MACVGKPRALLRRVVDPRDGFLATERFPTIAALNEWFAKHEPELRIVPEHKLLPHIKEEPWTPEEAEHRAQQADRAQRIADEIRKTANRARIGRRLEISMLSADERKKIADYIADPKTD